MISILIFQKLLLKICQMRVQKQDGS